VVAPRLGLGDGRGVPAALAVVIAVGVGAVGAAASDLVADHRAADSADDGSGGLVVARDGVADDGADDAPSDRARHAVVVLLLAADLSKRESRDHSGRGDAGGEKVVAHVIEGSRERWISFS